ncbi:hypothetical protein [Priestia megaterium]|uniref:hypothetical protein n=1 Tax=Priestia megaterium TaxID=1404 RepID=UPI0018672F0F|nr:hypothetical protein [Priestia megaterium]MBE2973394.1 hypothetical protein [Priestia megaterium]
MSKATNDYKRERGLTIHQLNAIDLLVCGKTDKEVADLVSVNRVTVTKWRNYDIYFQAELNKRRKEVWNASIDKIRTLVPKAIESLEREIEAENSWKVALEILKIAGISSNDVKQIGKDDPNQLLTEAAQQKMMDELISATNNYSTEELLEELESALNE